MFRKVSANKAKAKKPLRSRRTSDDDDDDERSVDLQQPVDDAADDAKLRQHSLNASSIEDGESAVGTATREDKSMASGAAVEGHNPGKKKNDAGSDSGGSSLLQTIAATKRKRKLLTELQYKRGTDASQLLVPRSQPGGISTSSSKVTEVSGMGTIAATDDGTTAEEEPSTVLEKKHRQAMQEYVRQNLLVNQPQKASVVATDANEASTSMRSALSEDVAASSVVPTTVPSTATDLFAELATQANALQQHHGVAAEHELASASGAAVASAATDSSASTSTSVMLHGTGIVEVVLPTIARAQQTSELVEAAETKKKQQYQYYRNRNKRQSPDGDGNQVAAAGATSTLPSRPIVHKLPSRPSAQLGAVPNRFRTYQPPPPEGGIKATTAHDTKAADSMHPPRPVNVDQPDPPSADDAAERPGFAGFQRKGHHHHHLTSTSTAPASNSSSQLPQHSRQQPHQQQRASDHVVYKKFVTHQQQLPNKKW